MRACTALGVCMRASHIGLPMIALQQYAVPSHGIPLAYDHAGSSVPTSYAIDSSCRGLFFHNGPGIVNGLSRARISYDSSH